MKRYPRIPGKEFKNFVGIVRRLRKECPWDKAQTHQSIRHALIEETYEVVDALDNKNMDELRKELGDLFLHIVMHATMGEQSREFSLKAIIGGITKKLIDRHPHVFGAAKRKRTANQVKADWELLKMKEGRTSILDGIPKQLPALQRSLCVQERVAHVGFDWPSIDGAIDKVKEELRELKRTIPRSSKRRREEEFGDLLFALVNYGRFLEINPENALRATIQKFTRRFQYVEKELLAKGVKPEASTLKEMDKLWERAKRKGL